LEIRPAARDVLAIATTNPSLPFCAPSFLCHTYPAPLPAKCVSGLRLIDARQHLNDLSLLATAHCPSRSTPRSRVCAGALTARRHASSMPQATVTPDVHQPLDVHCDFPTQITLDPHLFVDDFANAVDLVIRQIPNARVRADIRALEQLLAGMQPDTKDIRQRRLNSLVARKIDSCNSRHVASPFGPAFTRAINPGAACAAD